MEAPGAWLPWRQAWSEALYGPDGFYTRACPVDHFRTSVHTSPLFAAALVALVRDHGLRTVVDLGSGAGELLRQMHALAPDLELVGVELRARPASLPPAVDWRHTLPERIDGLLVANELLDNVACDVVERDDDGRLRYVEVDPGSGDERLGATASDEVVHWVDEWWPLPEAGRRAEVGLAREDTWAQACGRLRGGMGIAIDYGHVGANRPPTGTLTSYRGGRVTAPSLDGHHDVTAHVAMDALAARVGGTLELQRDVLSRLGVRGRRPDLRLATTDPQAYVRALASASGAAELMAVPGLGSFHWLVTPTLG